MASIEDLRNLDERVHEVIQTLYPEGIRCVMNSSAPRTGAALVSLVSKTEFLKNSILEIAESDNVYCVKILFRSLVEHYLKFQYLFSRQISEKTDEVGAEYYEFCDLVEEADMISAQSKVAKILDPSAQEISPFHALRSREPNLAPFSNRDIRRKAGQFKHRQMIEFLLERVYKDEPLGANNFLLSIIPKYSELSSFVHGGPSSDKYIVSSPKDKRGRETFELVQIATIMATHVKYTIFVLFSNLDKRFAQPCSETSGLLRAITTLRAT